MKNLSNLETEKLDSLPKYHPTHRHTGEHGCGCSWCYERHGRNFPWRRADRFLKSKLGQPWAHISSLWTHADWLQPMHREYHKLTELVETHTFVQDGRVAYYEKYNWRSKNGRFHEFIDEQSSEILYVHPVTRKLCLKKKEPKTAWKARRAAKEAETSLVLGDYHQLLKLYGIWYEVWADTSHQHIKHLGPHARLLSEGGEEGKKFVSEWFKKQDHWFYRYSAPKIYKRQCDAKTLKKYGLKNDAVKI
jgi:hypothetical protein